MNHHVGLGRVAFVAFLSATVLACAGAPSASPWSVPTAGPSESPSPAASPSESPSPAASPSRPLPTSSPLPSLVATSSPQPSAAASPRDEIVGIFLAEFADAKPPFHLVTEVAGRFVAGAETAEVSVMIEGDVAGDDFAGATRTELPDETIVAEVILLEGIAYVSREEGPWQVAPDFRQTQPLNPFILLAPADITYEGIVDRAGTAVHQLRTTRWIGDEIVVDGVPDAQLESSAFDIFVGDDGIPVEADLAFVVVGTAATGGPARFEYTVHYWFSAVGMPVAIESPIG